MSHTSIRFTDKEIENAFMQNLTGPHKELLSRCVNGLMDDSSWRKEKLLKAIMGIEPRAEHTLHEEYVIKKSAVSIYDIDEQASIEQGFLVDNMFTVKLIEFLPWSASMYKIAYAYVKINGEIRKTTYELSASELVIKEEFPEDL